MREQGFIVNELKKVIHKMEADSTREWDEVTEPSHSITEELWVRRAIVHVHAKRLSYKAITGVKLNENLLGEVEVSIRSADGRKFKVEPVATCIDESGARHLHFYVCKA